MTHQSFHSLSAMIPETSKASVNQASIMDVPLLLEDWPFPDLKEASAFDVDPRTGFMASQPPLSRLPVPWDLWESMLDSAVNAKLQLGDKIDITEDEKRCSASWRVRVRNVRFNLLTGRDPMPVISTVELKTPALLRRAHLVLAFVQHFYIQSLPLEVEPIVIPRSVALPLLHVSQTLDIPPILTLSDTVLYNWYIDPTKDKDGLPHPENVRTRTMFTNTIDEEEFYLCSSRIELRGVEALELMKMTMDEMFIGDHISIRRISAYLKGMVTVINDCRNLLLDVKKHCRPDVYYNDVRPWFRGHDSDNRNRQWIFEGIEDDPTLRIPTEISGPSAGQSSMVHAFDIFLGVDHSSATQIQPSFMSRMQVYMPRNHRLFLDHLKANSRPLRSFVLASKDEELTTVYNQAVMALKGFRDSHMVITALYVIGPARRTAKVREGKTGVTAHDNPSVVGTFTDGPLKGTGGSELVQFLKDTRTRTIEAVVSEK